jgi:hypothetical protein
LAQEITVSQTKVIVPSNLPKFREDQTKEPTEFLEVFKIIMKVHVIATITIYISISMFDTIDGSSCPVIRIVLMEKCCERTSKVLS